MKIITVCGSLKFKNEMIKISEEMQLQGNCILNVVYPTNSDKDAYTEEQALMIGQMHKEKIKLSDAILVVNVNGYIGTSTKSEIEFAKSLNKEIIYYTDLIKEDVNNLSPNMLITFLIKAKKQTYANSDVPKITASRLGSNDYHYEEEIEGQVMQYHDTYFGGTRFMGEEVVYRGTNFPKWGMNYYGITIDGNLSEEAMDKALRPALMKVGEDNSVIPVRGPRKFQNEDYLYTFKCDGDIENFTGIEEIYKDKKLVYKLQCHGGLIE